MGNPAAAQDPFSILGDFGGGEWGGNFSILSGPTLYWVATYGDAAGGIGTILKINTDGTGSEVMYSFSGSDGIYPNGSLVLSGSTLYGTTANGGSGYTGAPTGSGQGATGNGVIFKINTDGTGFEILHSFSGAPGDGASPAGTLTLSGSTLYGMTSGGSADGSSGTIFQINTDGTGFQVLYSFTWGVCYGPTGSLTLSGSTLYWMTTYSANNYSGGIFKINTDGTGFQVLHYFSGGASDGANPGGSLTLSGSTLYGATPYGGPWSTPYVSMGLGTIFKINTDGTGYQSYTTSVAPQAMGNLLTAPSPSRGPPCTGRPRLEAHLAVSAPAQFSR